MRFSIAAKPTPIRARAAVFLKSLPLALLFCAALPSKAAPAETREGVVYVESNIGTANGNSILAYRRDAAGNLTALPDSPYATDGTGIYDTTLSLGPFDSDQNIIVNRNRTLLFAVNSGSNTIAVFHIRANGSLKPVKGSPFASGGINPVSIGLAGDTLAVVNKNQDINQPAVASLPNYTTFHVNGQGQLEDLADTTYYIDQGASPSQALISPNNKFVFGADFMGGLLRSFTIADNGSLSEHPPLPLPDAEFADTLTPRFPLGLDAHPKLPILYVGFVTINRMGVYTYDTTGTLHFERSVPNTGKAICWITGNKAGTRLYTTNTADNSVSVYDLTDPLAPVEIQKVILAGNSSAFQLSLDSKGKFLYVVGQRSSAATPLGDGSLLHVLKVDKDGLLREIGSSPLTLPVPAGTRPQGVVGL